MKVYILNGRNFNSLDEATKYANDNGWIIDRTETLKYKGKTRVLIHVKAI